MKISRRYFLGVSLLAVAAVSPKTSEAWFPHGTPAGSVFFGNPNTTISSIGGGITASRTIVATDDNVTNVLPTGGFVHVSASGITCTGTRALASGTSSAVPYEDLEFTWNFGDSSGTETFTRPTDGATVNANIQVGPEAVYCYRKVGTGSYTITLTVRGKNGSGYTTASFTQVITVNAFAATNGRRYVDSGNGNNAWSGTLQVPTPSVSPTDGPWADLSGAAFVTFMASGGNKAIYIAQGGNITGSAVGTGIKIPNGVSNWRVGSYIGASGAGARPIVNGTTTSLTPLELNGPSAGTKDDILISGISFQVSDGWTSLAGYIIGCVVAGSATGNMSNIYLDHVDAISNLSVNTGGGYTNVSFNVQPVGGVTQWWGWWGGTCSSPIYTSGSASIDGFFGGPLNQGLAFYNVAFSGCGNNSTLDHHVYPETLLHSIYKWNLFGLTGNGSLQRNFCINTNYDGPNRTGALFTAGYIAFTENSFGGAVAGTYPVRVHDLGNADNDPEATQFINVVCERNAIAGITGECLPFSCGVSYTFRDNRMWGCTSESLFGPDPVLGNLLTPSIYRNRIYIPSSVSSAGEFLIGNLSPSNGLAFNTTNTLISGVLASTTAKWFPPGTLVRLAASVTLPGPFVANTLYAVKKNFSVVAGSGTATSGDTVTFSVANNNIAAPNITNLSPPDGVQVTIAASSLPSGYSANTIYFTVNTDLVHGTFQLSATRGGSPITVTSSGTNVVLTASAFTLAATVGGSEIQATSTGSGTLSAFAAWTQPWTFTDNIVWDARATPEVVTQIFSDQQAALSIYDRNEYWQTGASSSTLFFNNNGTSKAFGPSGTAGTWQNAGFDLNGSVAIPVNPSWNVPPAQWSDFGP